MVRTAGLHAAQKTEDLPLLQTCSPLRNRCRSARKLVRTLLRLYYPTIVAEGRERIPSAGAVLFVANHPNSLLDAALVGRVAQRPVHFFAKAPLFDVPVFGALMRAVGMVPAYRGSDDKAQIRRNLESLDAGAGYLVRGEAVGIFPEGKSHDLPHVELVRTGAARIAIQGARQSAQVTIVPLGLNYERKDRFRSSVWVRVGEPINLADLLSVQLGDERQAIRALTGEIERRLKEVVVHLSEERWTPFLHELEVLLPPPPETTGDPIAALRQRKRIADAMNYFLGADRPRAEAMAGAIQAHRERLAARGLSMESDLVRWRGARLARRSVAEAAYLLAGLVPAVLGALHHLVPFLVTRGLTRWAQYPGRATVALNRLWLGLPIYALWYGVAGWLLWQRLGLGIAVGWSALMPVAGIHALHFAWRLRHATSLWLQELRLLFRPKALGELRRGQLDLRHKLQSFPDPRVSNGESEKSCGERWIVA